jgi:Tfp pilus assembly protein PilF
LLSDNNEMGGAKQAYEEALQIYRQLAEKNPDVYRPDVAMTLNNLGALLYANNEMGGAKQAYEEALMIRRQLAEKNPDVYRPDVAMTLNNLGALLYANNEMGRAKQAFEEALMIYRQLAEKNPDVYRPYVAMTLNNLGNLLSDNNEMGGAKNAYEEALMIRRQLAEKNPKVYNLDAATTDINIGLFYEQLLKSTGDMSLKAAGLELMKDAEQRLTILPDAHPRVQQYRPYIERLTQFFNDFDEGAFQLQTQIDRLSALKTENETETDPYEKVQRQQEILSVLSEIEKTMPGNKKVANLIAAQYGWLAWYQLFVRQFAAAEQAARAGLAKDPGEEWINTNLVLALLFQGKWEAAKQVYETQKDQPYGNSTYRTTYLEDLDTLEKEGITHPDVAKARKLLGKK